MNKIFALIGAALMTLAVYGVVNRPDFSIKSSTSDLEDPAPSLVQALSSLSDVVSKYPQSDRDIVGDFYSDFADVVARDDSQISSIATFNNALGKAEILMFQETGIKLPGFSAAAREFMKETVGLANVAMTDEKRQQVVDSLNAIAWTCYASSAS